MTLKRYIDVKNFIENIKFNKDIIYVADLYTKSLEIKKLLNKLNLGEIFIIYGKDEKEINNNFKYIQIEKQRLIYQILDSLSLKNKKTIYFISKNDELKSQIEERNINVFFYLVKSIN